MPLNSRTGLLTPTHLEHHRFASWSSIPMKPAFGTLAWMCVILFDRWTRICPCRRSVTCRTCPRQKHANRRGLQYPSSWYFQQGDIIDIEHSILGQQCTAHIHCARSECMPTLHQILDHKPASCVLLFDLSATTCDAVSIKHRKFL